MKYKNLCQKFILLLIATTSYGSEKEISSLVLSTKTHTPSGKPLLKRPCGTQYSCGLCREINVFCRANSYFNSKIEALKKLNVNFGTEWVKTAASYKNSPVIFGKDFIKDRRLRYEMAPKLYPFSASREQILYGLNAFWGVYDLFLMDNVYDTGTYLAVLNFNDLQESRKNREYIKAKWDLIDKTYAFELYSSLSEVVGNRLKLFGLLEDAYNRYGWLHEFFTMLHKNGKLPFEVETITSNFSSGSSSSSK